MNKRELTCIGCPMGCQISVAMGGDSVVKVSGNICRRGDAYARNEVINPRRIVTSTVPVIGSKEKMLPVKTATDIPKARIMDCIRSLKGIIVKAPVSIGDVILADVAGTGVDIVATKDVK